MSVVASFLIRESAEVYQAKASEHLTSHQLADFRRCPLLYRKKKLGYLHCQSLRDSVKFCTVVVHYPTWVSWSEAKPRKSLTAYHVCIVRTCCWAMWRATLRRARARRANGRDRSASLQLIAGVGCVRGSTLCHYPIRS
jgi:hypothetical protein